jgi:hypothetical protein
LLENGLSLEPLMIPFCMFTMMYGYCHDGNRGSILSAFSKNIRLGILLFATAATLKLSAGPNHHGCIFSTVQRRNLADAFYGGGAFSKKYITQCADPPPPHITFREFDISGCLLKGRGTGRASCQKYLGDAMSVSDTGVVDRLVWGSLDAAPPSVRSQVAKHVSTANGTITIDAAFFNYTKRAIEDLFEVNANPIGMAVLSRRPPTTGAWLHNTLDGVRLLSTLSALTVLSHGAAIKKSAWGSK